MLPSPGREVKGHPFSGLLSQSGEQTRMWAIILLGAELICIWLILSQELACDTGVETQMTTEARYV